MLQKMLSKLNLMQKILLLTVIIIVLFMLAFAWTFPMLSASMYNGKENQTRNLVLTAYNVIDYYQQQAASGAMSEEDAKQAAMDAVKIMRYEGNNYFWINDRQPRMIMHPNYSPEDKPEWYSENGLINFADPNGVKLFVEMVNVTAKDGEGFVNYNWTKPGKENETPAPKISYVKLQPEWGWIVGSGVYVDDIETEINATLRIGLIIAFLGIMVALILSYILARSIVSPIKDMVFAARNHAQGDVNQDVAYEGRDEVGELADAFRQMTNYLKNMTNTANKLAEGDFTTEVIPLSENDTLGLAFQKMIANLKQLVGQITDSAGSLSRSAHSLSGASEEADESAGQVASAVKQVGEGTEQQTGDISKATLAVRQVAQAVSGVADGAQEQAGSINDSMMRVSQISTVVEQVSNNAKIGASQTMAANEVAEKGAKTVSETITGMGNIKSKVALSVEKVKEMGIRSSEIGNIVATIDDIAAQTNLLALNAAIEAARAGEHGKGFAVVADEVRKLAEKSSASTNEISLLIQNIQNTVSEAISAMEDSAAEVDSGVTRAEESGLALTRILEAMEGVQEQVSSIAAASEEMDAATSELVQSMESVSAVVEENTASTEEMAAGADELTGIIDGIASISEENSLAVQNVSEAAEGMSHQVEQVASEARSLNSLANDMMLAVARFKVSSGDEGVLQKLEVYRYAHMHWLDDLSAMFEGKKTFDEHKIPDHTGCLMGKWYYGSDADDFRNLAEFEALDDTHHRFHDVIFETISAYNAGDIRSAKASYQKVEAISKEMIAGLSALSARILVN